MMWRWRNGQLLDNRSIIENQNYVQLLATIEETLDARKKVEELNSPLSFRRKALISWQAHRSPKINIKINGTARGNLGPVEAGCILRGYQRQWIAGATHNVGITASISAELWGCFGVSNWLGNTASVV